MNLRFDLDKQQELLRYDKRAKRQLNCLTGLLKIEKWGSDSMPLFLASPYLCFEQKIRELVQPEHQVLELGAGSGLHTHVLLQTGAKVTATDISPNSLMLLQKNLVDFGDRLLTEVADMESLHFPDSSFDIITSAGSLSYGDPLKVDMEIHRLLRSDGVFICVDSLNHNPVYRLNRWLNYVRGMRTRSTLLRMPKLTRINSIADRFESLEVKYFGSLTWLMPLLSKLLGESLAAQISDHFDRTISPKKSAFKFVLVAKNPIK
jgi:SAM-dependent methyltransferase